MKWAVSKNKERLTKEYVYPAIFTYEDGKDIAVVFPDVELATSGANEADALHSAREALESCLTLMKEFGEDIPKASELKDIAVGSNERAVLVSAKA